MESLQIPENQRMRTPEPWGSEQLFPQQHTMSLSVETNSQLGDPTESSESLTTDELTRSLNVQLTDFMGLLQTTYEAMVHNVNALELLEDHSTPSQEGLIIEMEKVTELSKLNGRLLKHIQNRVTVQARLLKKLQAHQLTVKAEREKIAAAKLALEEDRKDITDKLEAFARRMLVSDRGGVDADGEGIQSQETTAVATRAGSVSPEELRTHLSTFTLYQEDPRQRESSLTFSTPTPTRSQFGSNFIPPQSSTLHTVNNASLDRSAFPIDDGDAITRFPTSISFDPSVTTESRTPGTTVLRSRKNSFSKLEKIVEWTDADEEKLAQLIIKLKECTKNWSPEQENYHPKIERMQERKKLWQKQQKMLERQRSEADLRRKSSDDLSKDDSFLNRIQLGGALVRRPSVATASSSGDVVATASESDSPAIMAPLKRALTFPKVNADGKKKGKKKGKMVKSIFWKQDKTKPGN